MEYCYYMSYSLGCLFFPYTCHSLVKGLNVVNHGLLVVLYRSSHLEVGEGGPGEEESLATYHNINYSINYYSLTKKGGRDPLDPPTPSLDLHLQWF